ncbi:MAG: GNAT family N-acetyltransferase [Chloroflexi bacterium]|nr:GNAT family N-acetyltransferase [Chloroflexota bacterium]
MLYELSQADYHRVEALYHPLDFHLNSRAVLDRLSPGRVFVDDPDQPRASFMLAPEACYLAGDADRADFNAGINEAIRAGEVVYDAPVLGWVVASEAWAERLTHILTPYLVQAAMRHHYICRARAWDWRERVPEGYEVRPIDAALLNDPALQVPEHLRHWTRYNWGTTGTYLERGFGRATLDGSTVVAWSVADCVTADGRCEIGIQTAPAYRRRGLATLTAAAAIDHALSSGLREVGWHCDVDNAGSIGTAERAGFELERHYTMYLIHRR